MIFCLRSSYWFCGGELVVVKVEYWGFSHNLSRTLDLTTRFSADVHVVSLWCRYSSTVCSVVGMCPLKPVRNLKVPFSQSHNVQRLHRTRFSESCVCRGRDDPSSSWVHNRVLVFQFMRVVTETHLSLHSERVSWKWDGLAGSYSNSLWNDEMFLITAFPHFLELLLVNPIHSEPEELGYSNSDNVWGWRM